MVNLKYLLLFCFTASVAASPNNLNYYSTGIVTLVGAHIAAQKDIDTKPEKHKRKDCPICKGKGWYISGDGIKKIDCQYCEPESEEELWQTEILRQ